MLGLLHNTYALPDINIYCMFYIIKKCVLHDEQNSPFFATKVPFVGF